MKHKISLNIKNIESPLEFEIEENTFKQITKFCQEKYPEKSWKTVSDF